MREPSLLYRPGDFALKFLDFPLQVVSAIRIPAFQKFEFRAKLTP